MVGVSPTITATVYGETIHLKMKRAEQNARHEHVMRTIQHRSVGKGHRCLDEAIEKSLQASEYSDALILNVTKKDTFNHTVDDDMKHLDDLVKNEVQRHSYDLEHCIVIILYINRSDYRIHMNTYDMNESLWSKNFCAQDCDCL